MPISAAQSRILRLLASNRNPESYLAGATVLHRGEESPRYSQDLDFFQDLQDQIALSAEQDAATLTHAGYSLTWLLRTPCFYRAVIQMDQESLRLEWAQDSAFRFYPVLQDDTCGYRLHETDASTNKILALAGRSEVRDFVDILYLDSQTLSLGALAWAACGKDPGFTPEFLLDQASRHTAYSQADLNHLQLKNPLDLHTLKQQWILAREKAQNLIAALPPEELGCLYVNDKGEAVTPDPGSDDFTSLSRHYGSVRGAWPSITEPGGSVA